MGDFLFWAAAIVRVAVQRPQKNAANLAADGVLFIAQR